MIDRSLERIKGMRSLILDLLDLTKIESGTKERKISRIDINELIVSCIDSIEPLAIQKNIKVHFQAVNSISYKAEEQEIRIILNNLLSNAVKYNVEDGNIYVDAEIKDSNLVISVEDTGIGISQEDMDKLFTEFTRIKNAKTRSISGSGLGLSITKKIVDTYEGNIKAESAPDKGSKFVVSLPL
jgi:signal transduction histidine kinase